MLFKLIETNTSLAATLRVVVPTIKVALHIWERWRPAIGVDLAKPLLPSTRTKLRECLTK